MRRREHHKLLIDDLECALFPFQESEEEQESFTREGRRRVDEWIDKIARPTYCCRQCERKLKAPKGSKS